MFSIHYCEWRVLINSDLRYGDMTQFLCESIFRFYPSRVVFANFGCHAFSSEIFSDLTCVTTKPRAVHQSQVRSL